jgi:Domain of unknown function (DUF4350)
MSVGLESGDRKFLIICGALLIALTGATLALEPPPEERSSGFPSSYSTAAAGSKAAYLLLQDLGYQVERWNLSPSDLPSGGNTVLILADPFVASSSQERVALRQFVFNGGRLLVTGALGASLVGESGVKVQPGDFSSWTTFAAESPSLLTRGAPDIAMKTGVRWARLRADHLGVYADKDGATVVGIPVGRGMIVWWADSGPLTNSGLTQASNLRLFLNSLGPRTAPVAEVQQPAQPGVRPAGRQATRVLWDEYFHGERLGFWSYLGKTPVPWFLVQLALVFAGILFSYGRRAGPLRPLVQESRLSPLEFVETLGDLYERKGAATGALEIAFQRFRGQLAGRLGARPSAGIEELYRGARERLGWTVPGLWETLQACELGVNDASLKNARSLKLIQELNDYSGRLGLRR